MDAGGEVAQLADRRLRVGERAVDQLARARRVGLEALARELQLDHQRHEPLLRAVVQVAPEPPALGVARLDEPRARRPQRLQPRAQLDLQARVLDRQRRGGGRLDAAARASRPASARAGARRRAGPRGRSRSRAPRPAGSHRAALAVDVAALGQPVGDVERRVAERVGERVAHVARVGRELLDQPRQRRRCGRSGVRTSPTQERGREAARTRRRTRSGPACRPAPTTCVTTRREAQHEDRHAEQQHRVEPAPLRAASSARQRRISSHGVPTIATTDEQRLERSRSRRLRPVVVGDQQRVRSGQRRRTVENSTRGGCSAPRDVAERGDAPRGAALQPAGREREQQVHEQRDATACRPARRARTAALRRRAAARSPRRRRRRASSARRCGCRAAAARRTRRPRRTPRPARRPM